MDAEGMKVKRQEQHRTADRTPYFRTFSSPTSRSPHRVKAVLLSSRTKTGRKEDGRVKLEHTLATKSVSFSTSI